MDHFRKTRVRLTLVYSLLFAAVAVGAAGAFWVALYESELGMVDASLRVQSTAVASTFAEARRLNEPSQALSPQTGSGLAITVYVYDANGRLVEQSEQTATGSSAASWAPSHLPTGSQLGTRTVGGQTYRILTAPVVLPDGSHGYLVLTRPVDELYGQLEHDALLLALVVLVIVAAAAALAYWLAGRALAPVRAMSARLQRFTADAAHELRAPLALLRTRIEVTLRQERSPDQYRESHRELLSEVERLSRVTDQLLVLARADAGVLNLALRDLDLPDLLEEVVARWKPRFAEQRVRLTTSIPADGHLHGDPDLLVRLLDNLLDNALRHARRPGQVVFSATLGRGEWRLLINDDGSGIDRGLRPRLFEPFFREDSARGRETGGAGLGLAICSAIAAAHRGSIALVASERLPGAAFLVSLPAPAAATSLEQAPALLQKTAASE